MTIAIDNLGFYTPTHATRAEEYHAIAAIRDGAWVPVSSGYGDADGFVSPVFIEVCEDAANQMVKDEAALRDELRDVEQERDDLLREVSKVITLIEGVPVGADAATMDAALTEVLAVLADGQPGRIEAP